MPTYQTPGVYVEELATLPPSVAAVSTAVPAFLGYTEKGPQVARISTLLEFEELFGAPYPSPFTVTFDKGADDEQSFEIAGEQPAYLLAYALRHFFANGGGECFVVSLGRFSESPAVIASDFDLALGWLAKEDEPTLIVPTDGVKLTSADYSTLCQNVLRHCEEMGDRFALLDVRADSSTGEPSMIESFRQGLGTRSLPYGAAYHPYLETTLSPSYDPAEVEIHGLSCVWRATLDPQSVRVLFRGRTDVAPQVQIAEATESATAISFVVDSDAQKLSITIPPGTTGMALATAWDDWVATQTTGGFELEKSGDGSAALAAGTTALTCLWRATLGENGVQVSFHGGVGPTPVIELTDADSDASENSFLIETATRKLTVRILADQKGTDLAEDWTSWAADNSPAGFELAVNGTGEANLASGETRLGKVDEPCSLASIEQSDTAVFGAIESALAKRRVILPPSAAVAGAYASVDRDRGVWKAPANISLSSVVGPTIKITTEAQSSLNVDPQGGKSINAIRAFSGKGTLIWGARTLAGNDNEWRYVPVRRLFNFIEESTRKATAFAVFEPNDATTWLKVQGMVESFLYGLWEQGALAGPTPDAAYFVHVGLGKTMTTQDVLEGRMVVEIGIAAVRPAEFIVLRFSHKLQQA